MIMRTEYEERLRTRARALADLYDIRQDTLACLGGARHAGLDPEALTGLVGCAAALGATSIDTYAAGDGWTGTHADERHFLGHVASIEDDIEDRYIDAGRLSVETGTALETARQDREAARGQLARARTRLATAQAMPTCQPCDGCHSRRAAAIDAAETAITEAEARISECTARIGICEDVTRTVHVLRIQLDRALMRIRAVPADLGETYESVYRLIRRGGHLAHEGRWITGETPVPA
jgi:hypothetical protein